MTIFKGIDIREGGSQLLNAKREPLI